MKPISRRNMLGKTSWLGTTVAIGLPLATTAADPAPGNTPPTKPELRVVVTGGHPGDPENGCGGTIARYTDLGHEVVLLYLNRGEWPENPLLEDAKSPRMAEARKACEILKARPAYAGQINGAAIVDPAHYEKFHELLKAERPDVVFTHWPIDNHANHRAISMLVYDAWLKMGKKFALYYYEVSNGEDTVQFTPTHYVDITSTETQKRSACYAHASQSPDKYYALQEKGHPDARPRERTQAGRGLHPTCAKPRLRAADGIVRALKFGGSSVIAAPEVREPPLAFHSSARRDCRSGGNQC